MTDANKIYNDLSAPAAADPARTGLGLTLPAINRRRFLQGALAAAAAGAVVPSWLADVAGAAPLGPGDGILVVIMLGGGNDGLNTVIPVSDGRYHDLRSNIAIKPSDALPIGSGMALHPALKGLKSRYDAGRLAIVQGVGTVEPDLSHFTSMATWMAGGPTTGVPTGWLGRWLDQRPADHVDGVVVGSQVPLHFLGARNRGSAIPDTLKDVFGTNPSNESWAVLHDTARGFARSSTGLGPLADLTAQTQRIAVDFGRQVQPLYGNGLPSGFARKMTVAARLINAGLGSRVIGVSLGSFDHHEGQAWRHNNMLGQLDEGITAFFAALHGQWASRTTVATFSEFGRRPASNASAGTDHGTSSVMFVTGAAVNGGLHGTQPSLSDLDRYGRMKTTVDFRSVYATLLDGWLGGNARQILGGNYEQLPLFGKAPSGNLSPAHQDVLRLYRAFFNRDPDSAGARYWIKVHDQGHSLDTIADAFTLQPEFKNAYAGTSDDEYLWRIYRNVLGRKPDEEGFAYWKTMLRSGKTTRGGLVRWIAANKEFASRYTYTRLP